MSRATCLLLHETKLFYQGNAAFEILISNQVVFGIHMRSREFEGTESKSCFSALRRITVAGYIYFAVFDMFYSQAVGG